MKTGWALPADELRTSISEIGREVGKRGLSVITQQESDYLF
jgi:hypothetical protein